MFRDGMDFYVLSVESVRDKDGNERVEINM